MFLQRYAHLLIDAFLGGYVKNLDPDALKISVWNGNIEINGVELQPEAFPLPKGFKLVKGTLQQLKIKLPWTNLAKEPVSLDIDQISILVHVEEPQCDDHHGGFVGTQQGHFHHELQRRQQEHTKKQQEALKRKRATLEAIEKTAELTQQHAKNKQDSLANGEDGNGLDSSPNLWMQSFWFKLLVKLLDNVQFHVRQLHVRFEDNVSRPQFPVAFGLTLESFILKSADQQWNYTLVLRDQLETTKSNSNCLRKKIDINRMGVYWKLDLVPTTVTQLASVEEFTAAMQSIWQQEKALRSSSELSVTTDPSLLDGNGCWNQYLIQPMTCSMKITVNDGNAKLPFTHQELSARVMARLGTKWMIDTIDLITDESWKNFVDQMPKLAGNRKYTLSFVFSEAWSVARETCEEEDEIPTMQQFKEALASIFAWPVSEVDKLEPSVIRYRDAVLVVMEEKSTYIDVDAQIDQIRLCLSRKQYLSSLSLVSFLASQHHKAKYRALRPKYVTVKENPALWWQYAIQAVLIDVRGRLGTIDRDKIKQMKNDQTKYKNLFKHLCLNMPVIALRDSEFMKNATKQELLNQVDDLEYQIDVQVLLKLRDEARLEYQKYQDQVTAMNIKEQNSDDAGADGQQPPPSRIWSYAAWLGSVATGGRTAWSAADDDLVWSEKDTQELYEAINYRPEDEKRIVEEDEDAAEEAEKHIWYRFGLSLASSGIKLINDAGLCYPTKEPVDTFTGTRTLLTTALNDAMIQILVRETSNELNFRIGDGYFYEGSAVSSSPTLRFSPHRLTTTTTNGYDEKFHLERMDALEIKSFHPNELQKQMSGLRLRDCENQLPLIQLSIEQLRTEIASTHLRVSLVTQPLKCNVNLVFLLRVANFFARPVNVDLVELEQAAWRRAQRLKRYSAAQMEDLMSKRTIVELNMDVIAPVINLVQVSVPPIHQEFFDSTAGLVSCVSTDEEEGKAKSQVRLLIYLGHLRATSIPAIPNVAEQAQPTIVPSIPHHDQLKHLYDVIEFEINGVEVQLHQSDNEFVADPSVLDSQWSNLLERSSSRFSVFTSVAPDDHSMPLVMLRGSIEKIQLNFSHAKYLALLQLLASFSANVHDFEMFRSVMMSQQDNDDHVELDDEFGTPMMAPPISTILEAPLSEQSVQSNVPGISPQAVKNASDTDLLKLWRRVVCKADFVVVQVVVRLLLPRDNQEDHHKAISYNTIQGSHMVVTTLTRIESHMRIRTYDQYYEFGLGSLKVEQVEARSSSTTSEECASCRTNRDIVVSGCQTSSAPFKTDDQPEKPNETNPLNLEDEQLVSILVSIVSPNAVRVTNPELWALLVSESPGVFKAKSDMRLWSQDILWRDDLLTPVSVDVHLQRVRVNVHQDTLAALLLFFVQPPDPVVEEDAQSSRASEVAAIPLPPESNGSFISRYSSARSNVSSSIGVRSPIMDGNQLSQRISGWVKKSIREKLPSHETKRSVPEESEEPNEPIATTSEVNMQVRLRVTGLSLCMYTQAETSSESTQMSEAKPFAGLTAEKFYSCLQSCGHGSRIFAYLTSLKILNFTVKEECQEMISSGQSLSDKKVDPKQPQQIMFNALVEEQETLHALQTTPAMFSVVGHFFGGEEIQKPWHPGYCSRFIVRLSSPRIRLLYSFVTDIRWYSMEGVLWQTFRRIFPPEEVDFEWEGEFQLSKLKAAMTKPSTTPTTENETANSGKPRAEGNDVVSFFPLVDIQLLDAVVVLPPHKNSLESLVLRYEKLQISNEYLLTSLAPMENKVHAKVLLNASLTKLQVELSSLRIVSNILARGKYEIKYQMHATNSKKAPDNVFLEQSLLGSTDFKFDVDLNASVLDQTGFLVNIEAKPLRFVCNQVQYEFFLHCPLSNLQEKSSICPETCCEVELEAEDEEIDDDVDPETLPLAIDTPRPRRTPSAAFSTASSGKGSVKAQGADTEQTEPAPAKHFSSFTLKIPEVSMELFDGCYGFLPTSTGDLSLAHKRVKDSLRTAHHSILMLDASNSYYELNSYSTDGRSTIEISFESVRIQDSRWESGISSTYRNVVEFHANSGQSIASHAIHLHFERSIEQCNTSTDATPRGPLRQNSFMGVTNSSRSLFADTFGASPKTADHPGQSHSASSFSSSHSQRLSRNMSTTSSRCGSEFEDSSVSGDPADRKEVHMRVRLSIQGFRVIPSNIHYNVLDFLRLRGRWHMQEQLSGQLNTGSASSSTVVRAGSTIRHASVLSEPPAPVVPTETRFIYSLDLSLGSMSLLFVEDSGKERSRALLLSWEASIMLGYAKDLLHPHRDMLQLKLHVDNAHGTSCLSQNKSKIFEKSYELNDQAASDCLKSISIEAMMRYALFNDCLRFHFKFDRVVELRFGYLDYCTILGALTRAMHDPFQKSHKSEQTEELVDSNVNEPSVPNTKSIVASRIRSLQPKKEPLVYGHSEIRLASVYGLGNLSSRVCVGFYKSAWRRGRYLILPASDSSDASDSIQHVTFRILPSQHSKRKVGEAVYYGDRICLECIEEKDDKAEKSAAAKRMSRTSTSVDTADSSSSSVVLIRKYDQLTANGYLGPDGLAGVFDTTIWKYGSNAFNSDRGVIYNKDTVVLEGLTIYRSYSSRRSFGASMGSSKANNALGGIQTAADTADEGDFASESLRSGIAGASGGYLMFNGVGDAPVPFTLWSLTSESASPERHTRKSKRTRRRKYRPRMSSASENGRLVLHHAMKNLKSINIEIPGIKATVVNDFNNMLLPLLHFRISSFEAVLRGYFPSEKFSLLLDLRLGIQAYNAQLAVWEPLVEDFDVNVAFHARGGVICDSCMTQREYEPPRKDKKSKPKDSMIECPGIPICLFRRARLTAYKDAARHSMEAKYFICRELLDADDENHRGSHTAFVVVRRNLNVNVSRNSINVLLRFFSMVTREDSEQAPVRRLGPFIYVDNQTGIELLCATHGMNLAGASDDPQNHSMLTGFDSDGTANSINTASPPARLASLLSDPASISDSDWKRVPVGERTATEIVAHEAPAGCVTSPLRRLIWFKPRGRPVDRSEALEQPESRTKAIPVPIGYSNRSFLLLESSTREEVWHGDTAICETVAEQGTLVLRLRGRIQVTNFLPVPVELVYNDDKESNAFVVEPNGIRAHYPPIQFHKTGRVSFCPLLGRGKLHRSRSFHLHALVAPEEQDEADCLRECHQNGAIESRRLLTFYWEDYPNDDVTSFFVSLPPFQIVLTSSKKSERHECVITLRPLITIENLLPYELQMRSFTLPPDEKQLARITSDPSASALFAGKTSCIAPGCCCAISELEIAGIHTGSSLRIALSVAIPRIGFEEFSIVTKSTLVAGVARAKIETGEFELIQVGRNSGKRLLVRFDIQTLEKTRFKQLNELAPVKCRVFCDYWLVDRTDLLLSYKAENQIVAPHQVQSPSDTEKRPDAEFPLTLFSFQKAHNTPRIGLCVTNSKQGEESQEAMIVQLQSDQFDASVVGVRGQVLVPRYLSKQSTLPAVHETSSVLSELPNRQFEFGVMIDQAPDRFSPSKVITILSRFCFVNCSSRFTMEVKQVEVCCDYKKALSPGESTSFHWPDGSLPKLVQIRLLQGGKIATAWSCPFEISSVGDFVLTPRRLLAKAPPALDKCLLCDEDDTERPRARRLPAPNLSVSIELHDPSFFIFFMEENPCDELSPSVSGTLPSSEVSSSASCVPFKIRNECGSLELFVWQKPDRVLSSSMSTYEGPERVLPFKTIDYLPCYFANFPTLHVEVRCLLTLESGKHSETGSTTTTNSGGFANTCEYESLGSFEVTLDKPHRLPSLELFSRCTSTPQKRIWIEVLISGTTKTLVVKDHMPGNSAELRTRRRANLLRDWRQFNSSINYMNRWLKNFTQQLGEGQHIKKQVRFADDQLESTPSDRFAIAIRLGGAMNLHRIYTRDLQACRPFLRGRIKTDEGQEGRKDLKKTQEMTLFPQQTAIFPEWLPSSLEYGATDSGCLINVMLNAKERCVLEVEVRERDRILFGSSLLASFKVQLHDYAIKLARSRSLQVFDVLGPLEIHNSTSLPPCCSSSCSETEASRPMVRIQVCCESLPPKEDIDSVEQPPNPFDRVNKALEAHVFKKELDKLHQSRNSLQMLLEQEALDVSTRNSLHSEGFETHSLDHAPPKDEVIAPKPHMKEVKPMEQTRSSESSEFTNSEAPCEELKKLTAVVVNVCNLKIPVELIEDRVAQGATTAPKVYCTLRYKQTTRCALSAAAKPSTRNPWNIPTDRGANEVSKSEVTRGPINAGGGLSSRIRTFTFPIGQKLGLDLVYRSGRVVVQGVACNHLCGSLMFQGKIFIGDTIMAVNSKSIVNLHQEACFTAIEQARMGLDIKPQPEEEQKEDASSVVDESPRLFALSFLDCRDNLRDKLNADDPESTTYDVEWNRRVEFLETAELPVPSSHSDHDPRTPTSVSQVDVAQKADFVCVRLYLRDDTSDHGLSAAQESSVVPFLYFFGDDIMMDYLDHSKQDNRFDVLLAECWVPLMDSSEPSATASICQERVCALYRPEQKSGSVYGQKYSASSIQNLQMVGQLRLALKWELVDPSTTTMNVKRNDNLDFYVQAEISRICVSIVDDGLNSSSFSSSCAPREVLCISISDQNASSGVQWSYGLLSDGRQVMNTRIGHFQVDNQLLETNFPVLVRPVRLMDSPNALSKRQDPKEVINLLPTFQVMAVFTAQSRMIHFEYIFAQLQELEVKLEDSTLVAIAEAFYGIQWSALEPNQGNALGTGRFLYHLPNGDRYAFDLLKEMAPDVKTAESLHRLSDGNQKIFLRWLLLCPIKISITFASATDQSLLLSMLSPEVTSMIRTVISAAAALVTNLDQAPIEIPEFYVENLFETKHTLAFYIIQHYVNHGLRSWYKIVGSVDFLGNPISLVSTLGTGVKDFFYTPAQMLLEDENGLRIENLRTGMTKGSKSLLRNTAVGIFHTTGKITETLGKGIAMLAMDEQYSAERQRRSLKQTGMINDLSDGLAEGSKGLVGGVFEGIKGVFAAPVRGAEQDGAGGFVLGIGKGFAGLIVKPTAGFMDLLTSISKGAKTSAESIDGAGGEHGVSRYRLPRRICSDGVLVSYSEREARGSAFLLLTGLDSSDEYVYHVDYGVEATRGLVMLTDKRVVCLVAKSGSRLWEMALDSTLEIEVKGTMMKIRQGKFSSRAYEIECDEAQAALNFKIAVDSARNDLSATRYLLLNLEKTQEEANHPLNELVSQEQLDFNLLMENAVVPNVQDTLLTNMSMEELQAQPLRSVRVEVCHLENKDAHAKVPSRAIDRVSNFSVFQIQVYGGAYQWQVYRRFCQFREFYLQLEEQGFEMERLPPFPTRTFFLSTRSTVEKYRQEALGAFLQAAIMHSSISRSSVVIEFLTKEAQEIRVSVPLHSPTNG